MRATSPSLLRRTWRESLKRLSASIEYRGGRIETARIEPPLRLREVRAIEQEVGMAFPEELVYLLQRVTGGVEFEWYWVWDPSTEDTQRIEHQVAGHPTRGLLTFRGESIPSCLSLVQILIEIEREQESDRWEGKVPLIHLENADSIAIDVSDSTKAPVVYLVRDPGYEVIRMAPVSVKVVVA